MNDQKKVESDHNDTVLILNQRLVRISVVFGLLSAVLLTAGSFIRRYDGNPVMHENLWKAFLLLVLCSMIMIPLWGLLLALPEFFHKYNRERKENAANGGNKTPKKGRFWLFWGILVLAYIPAFLAYYPGIFSYDASYQMLQVICHAYKTNHPLLHTLLMGVCYTLGGKAGSYAVGFSVYTLLQLLMLSFSYSFTLYRLYRKNAKKWVLILALAWYVLFPANAILGISATKDTLFAAFFLLFIVQLYDFLTTEHRTAVSNLFFVMTGILMLLFRNNALYGLAFAVPFLFLMKKGKRIWTLGLLLIMMAGAFIGGNLLLKATGAADGNFAEMLSVPLQQLARVDYYYDETMPLDLKEELHYFIPEEIAAQYLPSLSDPIKGQIDASRIRYELPRFLKLWGRVFLKYPLDYVDSFLINTMGIWHIEDSSHAYVYGPGGYLLTNHQPILEGYEIEKKVLFSPAHYLYEAMFSNNGYRKIPLFKELFAPALYVWMMMFALACSWYRKNKSLAGVSIVMVGYCLTLFLGPTVLVRYLFCIMVCCPFLLANCYCGTTKHIM